VALRRFNGTEQGFHGNLDKMAPFYTLHLGIEPYTMRSKGLEYVASHAAGAAFSFVTPPPSRACRAMGQGCDLQQALTLLI
jgi:hypothetical protein